MQMLHGPPESDQKIFNTCLSLIRGFYDLADELSRPFLKVKNATWAGPPCRWGWLRVSHPEEHEGHQEAVKIQEVKDKW